MRVRVCVATSDSVSILGELDFACPLLPSPPAAALWQVTSCCFTGERFSPKDPVGCRDAQSRMINRRLVCGPKSLPGDVLVVFGRSDWRVFHAADVSGCWSLHLQLEGLCSPAALVSVITPTGKLLMTLVVMEHLLHRSLMGQ